MPDPGAAHEHTPQPAAPHRRRRRRFTPVVVLLIGAVVGVLVAGVLNDALGITFQDKNVPTAPEIGASSVTSVPDFEPVATVVAAENGRWLRKAATHLVRSLEARTGRGPRLVTDLGDAKSRRIRTRLVGDDDNRGGHRSFTVVSDPKGLTVSAYDRRGLVRGYYWLADQIRTGTAEDDLLGRHPEAELGMRMVDLGGLGIPTDPDSWDSTNYSHNSRRFGKAVGFEPPYVAQQAFAQVKRDYIDYVDRMLAYGNNGLVQGGFLNLVNFDRVGDGHAVYTADSPYRKRHNAISEHMGELWKIADDAGMDVYLSHTELALTPPLEQYLRQRHGDIDAEDPKTWQVYQQALAEIFEQHPAVDGVMIRIGEAGEIYDPDSGLTYTTRLQVRTDKAVRTMLEAFLEVAERYDREIIFRSWTVGIGEVGFMHSRADVYQRVLGGLDSDNLVVSTKYVGGDFYRYLPFNETLTVGDQRRIVEMQNRLEFEGFMAFPNLISGLHTKALSRFMASNPNIEGIWQWTQNGGPQQAGPMSLYPFYGFWLNIDANVYTTSRLAANPEAEPDHVAADWVRRRFGDDPEVVEPLVKMLGLSGEAARKGLYVSAFADKQVLALGLETTPMMWIFEWDIVSGSSSVLSVIYRLARDDVDAAIAEGREAVALAKQMRALVREVDESKVKDPALLDKLAASVEYEVDLLQTLATWRESFLRYYQWLDTGDSQARRAWRDAFAEFKRRKRAHVARYGDNLDFPAYNFFAVEQGMVHAERSVTMAWLSRGLLAVLVLVLGLGVFALRRRRLHRWRGPAALVRAVVTPGRSDELESLSGQGRAVTVAACGAWVASAMLTFSGFASVHFPVLLGMMVTVFGAVLLAVNHRTAGAVLVGVCAPLMLLGAAFVSVAAIRGPGLFWYWFWTSPEFRTGFTVVAVMLLLWSLYGAWATVCDHHVGRDRHVWAFAGVLLACGAVLVAVGAVPAAAGLETMLTGFNNEMAILPLGLSMILGITTHLGIPTNLPVTIMTVGAAVAAVAVFTLLCSWWWNRHKPDDARTPLQ